MRLKEAPRIQTCILSALFLLTLGSSLATGAPPGALQSAAADKGEPCSCVLSFTSKAGQVDEFALPAEPTSRSTRLEDALPGTLWKDFDPMTSNRSVGHTFVGLPAGIVSAQLVIRMRPHNDLPSNDSIQLVLVDGVFQQTVSIASLPESGGTWTGNPATTFTIDLGPLGLVSQIATDRYLDFRVQDDTAVDYAWLEVGYCRSPLTSRRRGGLVDDFALPADRASRSDRLEDAFPAVTWKDFDDMSSQSNVGHTFAGLPAGILGAQLKIRMKPHSDVPSNDSLSMVLVDGVEQYSTAIIDLPEAGGSWSAGDPPAEFTLDLDALGLLSQVAADRYLDVRVQDDTAVDYAWLEMQVCGPLPYGGVGYSEVGDALLTPIEPNLLEVTGLDDEGDDGLSIELSGAQGYCLAFQMLCTGAEGTAVELGVTGRTKDFTHDNVKGVLTFAAPNPDVELSVAFDPPFDQFLTVEIWDDGAQVAQHGNLVNGPVVSVPTTACFQELDTLGRCFRLLLTDDATVTILQGGPTAVGDEIRICRDIIVGLAPLRITRFEVLGQNLDSMTVTGGAVQQFNQLHKPLGEATFEPSDDSLTIAGIGASGEDGVAIDLDPVEAFRVQLAPVDALGAAPDGAFLQATARGSLDGVPDQPLGDLTITRMGAGAFAIDADFTAIGSPTQHVQIYASGELVGDFPGHSGTAAVADRWPITLDKLGGATECYAPRFPAGTVFDVDGNLVVGNEIRILSEGASTVDDKTGFEIRAGGLAELTILGETVFPIGYSAGLLFTDGFETGNTSAWSSSVP